MAVSAPTARCYRSASTWKKCKVCDGEGHCVSDSWQNDDCMRFECRDVALHCTAAASQQDPVYHIGYNKLKVPSIEQQLQLIQHTSKTTQVIQSENPIAEQQLLVEKLSVEVKASVNICIQLENPTDSPVLEELSPSFGEDV